MKQSIYCVGCGKKIAKAELPALVEIACPKCKTLNDLSREARTGDKTQPFAERLKLEKKVEPPFGFNCQGEVLDARGRKLEKK